MRTAAKRSYLMTVLMSTVNKAIPQPRSPLTVTSALERHLCTSLATTGMSNA